MIRKFDADLKEVKMDEVGADTKEGQSLAEKDRYSDADSSSEEKDFVINFFANYDFVGADSEEKEAQMDEYADSSYEEKDWVIKFFSNYNYVGSDPKEKLEAQMDEVGPDPKDLQSLEVLYERLKIEDCLFRLEDGPKFVGLCFKILTYFKDGDKNVISFYEMVNHVLVNASFRHRLEIAFNKSVFFRDSVSYFGTQFKRTLEPADLISRIKKDIFLEKAIEQGEDHQFFAETLKARNDQMVIRGALSIILTYCISTEYLNLVVFESPMVEEEKFTSPKRIENPPSKSKNCTEAVYWSTVVRALALQLKDCSEIVEVSGKVLKFLIKDRDGRSFSKMVNQFLENKEFVMKLVDAFKKDMSWCFMYYHARKHQGQKDPAKQLPRIDNDNVVKQAIKERENHWFFKKSFIEGDEQMVVRCALSIVLPYCVSKNYLEKKNIWFISF